MNPFWSAPRGREVGDGGHPQPDPGSAINEVEKIRLRILKEAEVSFAKEIKRLTEDASSYASAASAAAAEQAKKEAGASVGETGGGLGPPGDGGGLDRPPGLPVDWSVEPTGVTMPEAVRSLELPALPSPSSGDASIQFGDWLTVVHPLMSDLSGSAQQWWDQAIKEAELLYDKWLSSSPLMRLRIKSELLVPDKFKRVEQRGISMLLAALPSDIRRAVITARQVSVVSALFKLWTVYQPGGAAERTSILRSLTEMKVGASVTDLLLRTWRRLLGLVEVDVVLVEDVVPCFPASPGLLVSSFSTLAPFTLAVFFVSFPAFSFR